MSGEADLQRMIAMVRKIPNLVKQTAPACAAALDAAIRAQLSAGHGPAGEGWAPRKADGARALANAGSNATVTKLLGMTIVTAVQFPYTFHNRGAGKSLPVRKIIPPGLTPQLAQAVKKPLLEAWAKLKAGGK
jgi:hypothetical protein